MGHRKGGTFANYVSVRDDTQSVFMETPTRDSLLKLASNASLTRDVSVPHHLSPAQKATIENDPEISELKKHCDSIRRDLISEHHKLKTAKEAGDKRHREFEKLQAKIRTKRKRLHDSTRTKLRQEFFQGVGNQIIEQNYHGSPVTFTPSADHIQPQRKALAELEFKNRDADRVKDEELIADRIKSLELRLELHKVQIPKPLSRLIKFDKSGKVFPLFKESDSGLECPVCLGCSELDPRVRTYRYARKDILQNHFKTHKLPAFFGRQGRECDVPDCSRISMSLPAYKCHIASYHKIYL